MTAFRTLLCNGLTCAMLLTWLALPVRAQDVESAPGTESSQAQDTESLQAQDTESASDQDTEAAPEPDTLVLSDTLTYDDTKRESVFTGNVIMTRGNMTLHSDKLVMHEDNEGYQYGTATVDKSELVYIRQENPEKFEVIEARGLRGEYDGKTEQVEVIGQAIVTRFVCGKPFDTIKGEKVVFNQKTDTYHAYSGPQSAAPGGRVRSLALPRAKSEAAAAECQQQVNQ